MRLVLGTIALTIGISSQGLAQQWEIGAVGGYGWYQNSGLLNSTIFSRFSVRGLAKQPEYAAYRDHG
jgi:hypothetical protein